MAKLYWKVKTMSLTVWCCSGTLQLDVPEFVEIQEDPENKTVSINVQDATVKQQKEMWGMSIEQYSENPAKMEGTGGHGTYC